MITHEHQERVGKRGKTEMSSNERGGRFSPVHEQEDLESLLLEPLQERRVLHSIDGLSSDVVDRLLDLWHAGNVILEARGFLEALRRLEAQELSQTGPVGRVLMHTKLESAGEPTDVEKSKKRSRRKKKSK